jgi:hypothetical protein
MQTKLSHTEDERSPAALILEQETADFNALIDEIWRRFTVRAWEMQRSSNEFRIDSLLNQ